MRKIPDTITEQEVSLLIKKAKNKKVKCAIVLMFWQCLRVSEVVNLTKDNVDISRGFLHIKQSKGKKDRDNPIQEESTFYLRYLPIKISRQGIHKAIKRLGIKELDKDIHPHTLRHSGASFYLNERGVDIRFIKDFLGHAKLSTTEIYTHVNPTQLKKAFDNARREPVL